MRKSFFAFLAAAMVAMLPSCDNEDKMGGDLLPSTDKASIRVVDTFEVKACTELVGEVASSNSSYLIVGELDDPIFGKTSASFAAKFSNSSYKKFSDNAVCDSVVVTFGIDTTARRFYGDSLANVTLELYKLVDTMSFNGAYTNAFDMSEKYDEVPLATATFVPRNADSLVRFVIDAAYGDLIIANTADKTYDENVAGFYVKASDGNCLMRFHTNNKGSQQKVYFHNLDRDASDNSNSTVDYTITSTDPRISMFARDFAGTDVEKYIGNYSNAGYVYLSSMAGTCIKLDFPDIAKLNKLDSKYMIVNRAQLVCPLADTEVSLDNQYQPLDKMLVRGSLADNKTSYFQEFLTYYNGESNPTLSAIGVDYANRCYTVNLTRRVVDMLDKLSKNLTVDYNVMLYPNGGVTDFERSVINSPLHPDKPMKLVVEYITYEK